MENNEIMNNEVIETTEEIIETGMSKGLKIAVGIGISAVVGFAAYKCVVKPFITKIKAANALKEMANQAEAEAVVVESEVVSEEKEN